MKKALLAIVTLSLVVNATGQDRSDFSDSPLNARFVTEDVGRFYTALEKLDTAENPFVEYIAGGSKGLQGFLEYRIYNADSLLKTVKERKQEYLNKRNNLDGLDGKILRVRAIYAAMKYWYPDAVFPPIYFVVGRFNSGGTVSENGIILGHEMQRDLEGLPGLVAHELIHFQQDHGVTEENWTLLMSALHEGGADFIGELISGENINTGFYFFGEKHLEKLALEFLVSMDTDDNTDWLYSTSGKDHRPNDLGYWIGYRITKAYFEKAEDKKQAIYDILHINNPREFLEKSGFLASYQQQVAQMTDEEKEEARIPFPSQPVTATFKVTVPNAADEVYVTGNHKNLGNWKPNAVKMNTISPRERAITLEINSPAAFKFTRGNWGSQALVQGVEGTPNLTYVAGEDSLEYVIESWTDEQ